jgi:RimJ/RimL family protein N-acetyltransferase
MNVVGKEIILRAIEKTDLPLLQQWSNNPEIQYWLGGWHTPTSQLVMNEWFEKITRDNNNLRFAIDHKKLGLIGTANIVDINWKDKNAFHGMLLGDKDIRGKGIGVDVVMTIMKYAFEEIGLERLDGSVIEYNIGSLKLYIDKCGWEKEGVKKNWYFRKNKFWDKVIVGITREKYFSFVEQTNYWDK